MIVYIDCKIPTHDSTKPYNKDMVNYFKSFSILKCYFQKDKWIYRGLHVIIEEWSSAFTFQSFD